MKFQSQVNLQEATFFILYLEAFRFILFPLWMGDMISGYGSRDREKK